MESISLTEKEIWLFDTLKDVLAKNNVQTVMRVAGGWVWDKLLGLESDDIDITLDGMTGVEFFELIKKHLEVKMIKCHNDKSQHLATATMVIFDN